jgi:hypothetical protein
MATEASGARWDVPAPHFLGLQSAQMAAPVAACAVDGGTFMLSKMTMTDEQRKSLILEYFRAFDNDGVRPGGGSILELFAPDAQVYFLSGVSPQGIRKSRRCFLTSGRAW